MRIFVRTTAPIPPEAFPLGSQPFGASVYVCLPKRPGISHRRSHHYQWSDEYYFVAFGSISFGRYTM
jgi:hypothetical protein